MKSTRLRQATSKSELKGGVSTKYETRSFKARASERGTQLLQARLADKVPLDFVQTAPHVAQKVATVEGISIANPAGLGRIASNSVQDSIDKQRAQRFWQLQRPYFFAIRKNKTGLAKAIDLEKLSENIDIRKRFPESIDERYCIFFVKSEEDFLPLKLPSLASLIEFGIPEYLLENFWTLKNERQVSGESIWLFSSRCTLAAFFAVRSGIIPQDTFYADHMTRRLTSNERKNGLNGALYLAAHSRSSHVIRILLFAGADPNVSAGLYGSQTGLAAAIERDSYEAAEEFLKAGADPDWSGDGMTITGREAAEDAQSREAFALFKKYR